MIKLAHISEHTEHIDLIANWMCTEWGNESNFEFFKSILTHSLDKSNLPQTLIALDGDTPVGVVGLWRCDMVSRQDLYPWLSGLYVIPGYRGQGVGAQLQNHLVEYAKSLGFKELYLYTDIENYYEKNGWEYIDEGITYAGEYDRIYRKTLVD